MHVWLAHELPAGAPRAGGVTPSLAVRLLPPVEPRTSLLSVSDKADGAVVAPGAPVARVSAKKARSAASSRDRAHDNAGADVAGIAHRTDLTYYPARQLDVYPALLAPLSITYPERALAEDRAGRALVMVLIDAAGKVNDVAVVEADPPGYFDEAARRTFERAMFSPARRNGMPVRSRVLIHVNFDPRTAGAVAQ